MPDTGNFEDWKWWSWAVKLRHDIEDYTFLAYRMADSRLVAVCAVSFGEERLYQISPV